MEFQKGRHTMLNVPDEKIGALVDACHRAAEEGLVRCSSGNMSWRIDGDRLLCSASRSWLGRLSAEQVSVCRIEDGALIQGPRPTVEIVFHAGILRRRPEIGVVLHFQTPAATALACRNLDDVDFNAIPEIPFYMGRVGLIPYLPPGSPELAAATIDVMARHDVAIMANHGQVTVAADFDRAIQNAVFFEMACDIILRNGDRLTPIPEAQAARLLTAREAGGTSSAA